MSIELIDQFINMLNKSKRLEGYIQLEELSQGQLDYLSYRGYKVKKTPLGWKLVRKLNFLGRRRISLWKSH